MPRHPPLASGSRFPSHPATLVLPAINATHFLSLFSVCNLNRFGVGFDASLMSSRPYVIIATPGGGVAERQIGYYSKGTHLSPSIVVQEVETLGQCDPNL